MAGAGIGAGQIFGFASEIAMSAANNYLAQDREALARKENYEYNEKAAQNADARTRKLYEDLYSPSAQIKQLKNAGLSPSLMYGGGAAGVSGHTGAMGAGASGISPTTYGMSPLEAAQIGLINAQSEKTKAETETIEGKNERGKAEISKVIAETLGENAKTCYTNVLSTLGEIESEVNNASKGDRINTIHYKTQSAIHEAEKLSWEVIQSKAIANVAEERVKEELTKLKNENKLLKADELFRNSQINLNDAEISRIKNECEKWQQELLQNWYDVFIRKQQAGTYEEYVKNLDTFQDGQIENLKERLKMDDDHFTRRQTLEYMKIMQTMFDNAMERGTTIICNLLPFSK